MRHDDAGSMVYDWRDPATIRYEHRRSTGDCFRSGIAEILIL